MPFTNGIDSLTPCTTASLKCLAAAGIGFVGRYYSRTTTIPGKKLTRNEALRISQAGLLLFSIYEDGPTQPAYFTTDRGVKDAKGAAAQAGEAGQPGGSAIYFTVDFDAPVQQPAMRKALLAYFSAVRDNAGAYAVGVYGSGAVCQAILDAKLARFAWLANASAWQGFHAFTGWAIKQEKAKTICTLNADPDLAQAAFGAWKTT